VEKSYLGGSEHRNRLRVLATEKGVLKKLGSKMACFGDFWSIQLYGLCRCNKGPISTGQLLKGIII